jgi:hypothetical protein
MSSFRTVECHPLVKNALRGFAEVAMPSGMILNDVIILVSAEALWVSPPSKAIGSDGVAMKDHDGRTRYAPINEFTSKEIRNKFSDDRGDAACAS